MSWKTWLVLGLAIALLAGVGVGTWLLLKPKARQPEREFSRTAQATLGTQTQSVGLRRHPQPEQAVQRELQRLRHRDLREGQGR